MTWTYDPTLVGTTPLFQVRLLVGDTTSTDPQMQDEEIAWLISLRTSVFGAASDAATTLQGKVSRLVDSSQGPLRTSYSQRARNYGALAEKYRLEAMVRSGAIPYSGQTSLIDYMNNLMNSDRIGPQFGIGMDDNLLPVGPVSNETIGIGGQGDG